MARSGIRFRPPEVPISGELRWVLLRAFGPPAAGFDEPLDSRATLAIARALEITPRIASRQPLDLLQNEIGVDGARALSDDRRAAAFEGLQRLGAAKDLASKAEALGLPIVLLKFMALHFAESLGNGSRGAVDIDALVPEEGLDDLSLALSEAGYVPRDQPDYGHHPPTFDHPAHGALELHRFIPGVRAGAAGGPATVADLEAEELLIPIDQLPGRCYRPDEEILISHALAHGLAQHGSHPASYPAVRLIADLIDLGTPSASSALLGRVERRIEDAVSPAEAAATCQLATLLARGLRPWGRELESASPPGVILRHFLAGLLDPDYEAALGFDLYSSGLGREGRWVAISRLIGNTIFPTRGQLDRLYGKPRHPAIYWLRRLQRPFSLLGRLARYSIAYLKRKNPR